MEILGFPCNQFADQELAKQDEIVHFCQLNYGVSFEIFEKVNVNGDDAAEIFKYLKKQKGGLFGSAIKWNFTKFLIDKDGKVIKRYSPQTTPEKMRADIEALL